MLAVFAASAITSASASALEFYNSNGELILGLLNIESLGKSQILKGELAGTKIKTECGDVHNRG
jgi:hypothetical protein